MNKNKNINISILSLSLASGGAEKVISLFLPELAKIYNVYLVLFYNDIHFPIPKNVNTVILRNELNDTIPKKILNFGQIVLKYQKFIIDNSIDVSVSFLTRPNLVNGIVKIRCPNLKVIMSERGYPSINYRSSIARYWLYRILVPLLYNKADIAFSNSHRINEDLRNNFGLRIPLRVIYNPVEEVKQKMIFSNNPLRLINIGSLRPIKNQMMILQSISNLSNVKLTIIGGGQLKFELEKKAKDLEIQQFINFEGIVSNVYAHLLKHDCFILSSNSEGFPNVILEAMASGLPIISTNCMSGPLEILNENLEIKIEQGNFVLAKYGILVNVGDVLGLEKAIRHLQENPDLLVEYGKLGFERSKDYNIEYIFSEFERMIDEL